LEVWLFFCQAIPSNYHQFKAIAFGLATSLELTMNLATPNIFNISLKTLKWWMSRGWKRALKMLFLFLYFQIVYKMGNALQPIGSMFAPIALNTQWAWTNGRRVDFKIPVDAPVYYQSGSACPQHQVPEGFEQAHYVDQCASNW
jgi:hypothetical protein